MIYLLANGWAYIYLGGGLKPGGFKVGFYGMALLNLKMISEVCAQRIPETISRCVQIEKFVCVCGADDCQLQCIYYI